MKKVIIYTDGGCDPNPGRGAWAALIIVDGKKVEKFGIADLSTNNRMELTAAIEALKLIAHPAEIILFTDSQYLQKGIEEWMPKWLAKNWKGSSGPVANQDLWKELLEVSKKHDIQWNWLKGHSGDPYNSRVDFLVRRARRAG